MSRLLRTGLRRLLPSLAAVCGIAAFSYGNNTLTRAGQLFDNAKTQADYRAAIQQFRNARLDPDYRAKKDDGAINEGIRKCNYVIEMLESYNGEPSFSYVFAANGQVVELDSIAKDAELVSCPAWLLFSPLTGELECQMNPDAGQRCGVVRLKTGNRLLFVSVVQESAIKESAPLMKSKRADLPKDAGVVKSEMLGKEAGLASGQPNTPPKQADTKAYAPLAPYKESDSKSAAATVASASAKPAPAPKPAAKPKPSPAPKTTTKPAVKPASQVNLAPKKKVKLVYFGLDLACEYYKGFDSLEQYRVGAMFRIGGNEHALNLLSGCHYSDLEALTVPVMLNWNISRDSFSCIYVGGGYDFDIHGGRAEDSFSVHAGFRLLGLDLRCFLRSYPSYDNYQTVGFGLSWFFL